MGKPFIEGVVMFSDTDGKWWRHPWRLITRDDFRHCKVLIRHNTKVYDDVELWSLYEPSWNATIVYPVMVDDFEIDILEIEHTHAVYFKQYIEPGVIIRGIGSCVGSIKQLLGIREYSLWTPYQLYKWLLKQPNNKEI